MFPTLEESSEKGQEKVITFIRCFLCNICGFCRKMDIGFQFVFNF